MLSNVLTYTFKNWKVCSQALDMLCWRCSPGTSGAVQRLLTIWSCQLSTYRFVLSSSWPAAFLPACCCFSTLLILWFDPSLWLTYLNQKKRGAACSMGTLRGPSGAAVVPWGSPQTLSTCCFSLSVLLGWFFFQSLLQTACFKHVPVLQPTCLFGNELFNLI